MVADSEGKRSEGIAHTDRAGKVFIVVGQDVRRCLVCEQAFTRQAVSDHAKVECHPEKLKGTKR